MTDMDKRASPTPGVVAYTLHGNAYLNLTNRCTLRCRFCPKYNGQWEVQGYPLRLSQEPTFERVIESLGNPYGYREVVFCGLGEPTLRLPLLLEVADYVHGHGVPLRLNTDGLANWRQSRDITPHLAGRIDRVSISLNAQNARLYDLHCRPPRPGAWQALLDFTRRVREQVEQVTVTAIDGLEGVEMDACRELAHELDVRFRRRVLDEVG